MRCRGSTWRKVGCPRRGGAEAERRGRRGDEAAEGKVLMGWSAEAAGRGREQKSDVRKGKKNGKEDKGANGGRRPAKKQTTTPPETRDDPGKIRLRLLPRCFSVKIRDALHSAHDWHDNPVT
ncbi:unnamed protein product [Chondrus crispus]|uniref:Uncharacterized protein n=1 Tax=Chondrus crispus TaxID=2769 RepID=R7Q819_CHOCR|nr:unnamed protein product [Chondrus crispus]CDF34184.1 unnamed protein product [Chondrus crispus]|eukprot:XP_005714003.1 unnamed protein product [Chondrus crispus]